MYLTIICTICSINYRVLTRIFSQIRLNWTARCKNSTHFPCVVYDQTMDQTAREKRTLQCMCDALNVEKNYPRKEQRTRVGRQLKTSGTLFATDSLTARTSRSGR